MLYSIVSIALLSFSASGYGLRNNRRVYAYDNPNNYQSSYYYDKSAGYNQGSDYYDSGYNSGYYGSSSADYYGSNYYDSGSQYYGSGSMYKRMQKPMVRNYEQLTTPDLDLSSGYYDSLYNSVDYDGTPAMPDSNSNDPDFRARVKRVKKVKNYAKNSADYYGYSDRMQKNYEQLTTPDLDLSSGYYDSLYNSQNYDGTPAMSDSHSNGPNFRRKTPKNYFQNEPEVKPVHSMVNRFRKIRNYGQTSNEATICKCKCDNDQNDKNDDCFKQRCMDQYQNCKLNEECFSAINKAESGICETGQIDCGKPEIMCLNGSDDCKTLWKNLVTCFNSCYDKGKASVQCVEDKCNNSGDLDSCLVNIECSNAIKNVSNGKCESDNYDCGNSNFMCNGDLQCIPIWNNIVNCYNNQCSNDNDNDNGNNNKRRKKTFVANEALKQYNRVKRTKSLKNMANRMRRD